MAILSTEKNSRKSPKLQQIGEWLKRLRIELNLSQSTVAQDAGIPIDTYRKWEQGRSDPTLSEFLKLRKLYAQRIGDIFSSSPHVQEQGEEKGELRDRPPTDPKSRRQFHQSLDEILDHAPVPIRKKVTEEITNLAGLYKKKQP